MSRKWLAMTRKASRRRQKTQNCPVRAAKSLMIPMMGPFMKIVEMLRHLRQLRKRSCGIARKPVLLPGSSETLILKFPRTLNAIAGGSVAAVTIVSAMRGICWALSLLDRMHGAQRMCAQNVILPATLNITDTMTAMMSVLRPIMTTPPRYSSVQQWFLLW